MIEGPMDPFVLIRALNVATIILIGGALLVFWRSSDRTPFLLHWSLYEFALAGAVAMHGFQLGVTVSLGIGVPVLLFGIYGYRKRRPPPRHFFVLMFLAIALPAIILTEALGRTAGIFYLSAAVSVGYLAAAALFVKGGGALNIFIAAAFFARIVNTMSFPLWDAEGMGYVSFAIGQVLTQMAGVGMLMAGFTMAYRGMKRREQELVRAYSQTEELMLRLEESNEEYRHAREKSEAANAAKTQFLANMSHELRTPLNAILGFSEVLLMLPAEQVRDKVASYARNIHDAAGGLQTIISDILNLARVEAGALDLQQETCDLAEILAEVRRLLQPLADQKDITLELSSAAPCLAYCDRRLTQQALVNGVSNAIKYTQRGGRVICDTGIDGNHAVATVEDNGVGIDETRLAKVFEPFWQAGNSFVAENAGVGLGLNIAKSYIEAQGGRIELRPARERGTVFRVAMPLTAEGGAGAAAG